MGIYRFDLAVLKKSFTYFINYISERQWMKSIIMLNLRSLNWWFTLGYTKSCSCRCLAKEDKQFKILLKLICGNISLTHVKNSFNYILSYFTVSLFENNQNIQININELDKNWYLVLLCCHAIFALKENFHFMQFNISVWFHGLKQHCNYRSP